MTQVDFYTNAPDRLQTACRLCAKAVAAAARVHVLVADADAATRLSRLLWTTPATGFVPHCGAADPLAAVTPVIVDHRTDAFAHDDVLINLCDGVPDGFSRFRRLIEIVSAGEADRAAARDRYRHYRDRGYALNTHDLAATRRDGSAASKSGSTAAAGS
jgi:DNA polymerase-3 subunit chi